MADSGADAPAAETARADHITPPLVSTASTACAEETIYENETTDNDVIAALDNHDQLNLTSEQRKLEIAHAVEQHKLEQAKKYPGAAMKPINNQDAATQMSNELHAQMNSPRGFTWSVHSTLSPLPNAQQQILQKPAAPPAQHVLFRTQKYKKP